MNDIRDSALHCEAKKHAYRQTQDGVVVSFVLHPQEIPDGLAIAPLGTRYMLALVEIGDDEKPKNRKDGEANPTGRHRNTSPVSNDKTPPAPAPDQPARATRPIHWHDMTLAQQAGILCNEPSFWKFLNENYPANICGAHDAATLIRSVCDVRSRSELDPDRPSGRQWRHIASRYRAWMKEPEVV